ncbi:hypothetical protein GCM10011507_21370 [Edaphobacter acidisoli]|uniref:DUF6843 domain-containing protein n=2 Tax=Edaphobacter acidisoli TaxID=2040573 RepID=A0A916RVI3_9BACT|nr:hypothetical protein GCM10011507_21370 [Edaphobacter acidisoli]
MIFAVSAFAAKRPRYIFELPDDYIGWVQIVFNDPNAAPLQVVDGGVLLGVPESGIVRTSTLRMYSTQAPDEFYYRVTDRVTDGTKRKPVPADYVLPGISHGGFGVMDTGGHGKGYSWFFFVGPPEQRKEFPLANWDEVVAAQRKLHGNAKVPVPKSYPMPGRVQLRTPGLPTRPRKK